MIEEKHNAKTSQLKIKANNNSNFKKDFIQYKSKKIQITGNKKRIEINASISNKITIRGKENLFNNKEEKSYNPSLKIRIRGIKNDFNKIDLRRINDNPLIRLKSQLKRNYIKMNPPFSQISNQYGIENDQNLFIPPKSGYKNAITIHEKHNSLKDYRSLNIQDKKKDRFIERSKIERFEMNSESNNKDGKDENQNVNTMNLNSKNALFLKKDEFIELTRVLIDYIKEKIGVVHNNFNQYHDFIKEYSINVDELTKELSLEDVIIDLMRKANLVVNDSNAIQARRCFEVISFALLKCYNYENLKIVLKRYNKLSDSQIRIMIKKYIPFIKKLNSDIKIDKWLPSINLSEQELKKIAIEKKLRLLSNYSDYQNRNSVLKWECLKCGNIFTTKVILIQINKYACPKCRKNREKSLKYNLDSYYEILTNFLEENIKILFKIPKYKSIIIKNLKYRILKIFDNVINSYNHPNDNDNFIQFYEEMGESVGKSPEHIATAIIYIIFKANNNTITQSEIVKITEISKTNISLTIRRFLDILKRLPNNKIAIDLILPKKLTLDEYKKEFEKYLKMYIDSISSIFDIDKSIDNEVDEIIKIFLNAVNSIQEPNKLKKYLDHFNPQKPYIQASIALFFYLKYKKDIDIRKKDYIKIINSKIKELDIHKSSFISNSRIFFNYFFKLNEENYKTKVISYITIFINKLKNLDIEKNNNISNDILEWFKNNNISLLQKWVNNSEQIILKNAEILYSEIMEKNFNIIYISHRINYLFPQYMALSILYFTFKSNPKFKIMASKKFFNYIFGITSRYKQYINSIGRNDLISYIREIKGRLHKQRFNREDFINYLKKNLRKHYHLETDFFLNLYQFTDLSPQEFGENLGIYGAIGIGNFLQIVKNRHTISEPQVFQKIKSFIHNYIPKLHQEEFFNWINNIEKINQKDFNHQGIIYRFQWNPNHIEINNKIRINNLVYNYLNLIWNDVYPRIAFISNSNPRASKFKFQGSQDPYQPIQTKMILTYFKKKLTQYNQSHPLSVFAKDIFIKFDDRKIGKKPDHAPILQYTLLEFEKAIATEVPVWMENPNSNNYYVGHIDLLLVNKNDIIIADFKQSKSGILKSIPQLMTYALLLKYQLQKLGDVSTLNIKCIGYTKNIAFEFDPFEIKKDVLSFINQYIILKDKLLPLFNSLFN